MTPDDPSAFFGTVAQVAATIFAIVGTLFTDRFAQHLQGVEVSHDKYDRRIASARRRLIQCLDDAHQNARRFGQGTSEAF